ncbi:MAG: glucan biosynthesis protein C [Flavobacteriales bacterium]|jgi:glucan biosynthesis protein C
MDATAHSERLYFMDNLRAFAMMLGVVFHVILAYSPYMSQVWPSANSANSVVVDVFAGFSHTFRMPLFFVVAGFFCAMLTARRGYGGMLKNRGLRVLLPLVIFLPILTVLMIISFTWALKNVEHLSPILRFIKVESARGTLDAQPPSTIHLWFLYYLCMFYLLVGAFRILIPVRIASFLASFFLGLKPIVALIVFPLLLIPAMLLTLHMYPAPEYLLPQIWAIMFFGAFFAYGYLMFRSFNLLDSLEKYAPWLVLVSCGMYAVYHSVLPAESLSLVPAPQSLGLRLALGIPTACISVYMSLASFIYARKFLNSSSKTLRLISDSSYWVYLVHVPLLFAVQFAMLDRDLSWPVAFIVSLTVVMAISMGSYFLLVRWTPLTWLLNGRKRREVKG